MQDAPKAVWSIPNVSVAFFPSLKHNFIAYRSSKVSSRSDCSFEIHQRWQLGFSRVYSNCCCSCSFEAEIINIGQSFYKIYSNNILNCQESTAILNGFTKKSGYLLKAPRIRAFKFLRFKIEVSWNNKIVNFLDVTLNLSNNTYKPFLKTDQYPSYINVNSSHPKTIIKQVSKAVKLRIRNLSANEKIFQECNKIYKDALKNSRFREEFTY